VVKFTLSTTAMWAEITRAGSIITGLIVGWFQLRNFRLQQRDIVAINLAQTFYSRDLARASTGIQPALDGISLDEIRQREHAHE